MEIILKPKGRGVSSFVAFLGKTNLSTNKINGESDEHVCKPFILNAIINKRNLWLLEDDKQVSLIINFIKASNNKGKILFNGLVIYKAGYGEKHVNVIGSIQF